MERRELAEALLAGLIDLETSGDVVLIHSAPSALADRLCSAILQRWSREFQVDPPEEVVIEEGIQASSRCLEQAFGIEAEQALVMVRDFVRSLAADRTRREMAQLLSHQGPQEIADGAFYCIHLRRGDYYSPAYLAWRKNRYPQRPG